MERMFCLLISLKGLWTGWGRVVDVRQEEKKWEIRILRGPPKHTRSGSIGKGPLEFE